MANKTEQPSVDFAGGAVGYRFRRGGERGHPVVRAAGIRKDRIPSIVDATAGLGRDAFLLASAGAAVTLIERSAEVHALLKEALAHAAAESPDLAEVVARMTLIHGDAKSLLPELKPDVVIVDPMHTPRVDLDVSSSGILPLGCSRGFFAPRSPQRSDQQRPKPSGTLVATQSIEEKYPPKRWHGQPVMA